MLILIQSNYTMHKYRYKIHDKIYDLTNFVEIHPGGTEMFNHLKPNTNITPMFYSYHKNPQNILKILPKYEVATNKDVIIKCDTNYIYDKYCELKLKVFSEIKDKNIPLHWSTKETSYNVCMFSIWIYLWGYCIYNGNNISNVFIVLLSLFTCSWGVLVFHETSHYTGFKNNKYNLLFSKYFPFTNMNNWKYRHNYLHHSFTNSIYDYDLQLEVSDYYRIINTNLNYIHRFQYIYMNFIWLLGGILFGESGYFSLLNSNKITVFLLFYFLGVNKMLLFYSIFGFNFLFIATLSHIQHECIQINTENKNDFLYNQVSSSINYKTNDIITRFICFGLDIQIEHHLFPNIPHSSLRLIQPIVREYCENNNIPYIQKFSIFTAIYSYIQYLYKMGQS